MDAATTAHVNLNFFFAWFFGTDAFESVKALLSTNPHRKDPDCSQTAERALNRANGISLSNLTSLYKLFHFLDA